MAQTPSQTDLPRYGTLDEYFKLAEASLDKLEYRGGPACPPGGEIVAGAGASENHNLIVGNIGGALWTNLRGKPCRYYPADQRVGVRGYPTYTYSDGLVICGPTVLDERDKTNQTVKNPSLELELPLTEVYLNVAFPQPAEEAPATT